MGKKKDLSPEEVEQMKRRVKDAFQEVMNIIAAKSPALHLLATGWEIIPGRHPTAFTDGDKIYLPYEFAEWDLPLRILVFLHEALHITFLHPLILARIIPRYIPNYENNYEDRQQAQLIFNLAADAKVNLILEGLLPKAYKTYGDDFVSYSLLGLDRTETAEKSVDELFLELFKRKEHVLSSKAAKMLKNKKDLQPNPNMSEEKKEEIKEKVRSKWAAFKAAGSEHAGILRELERLFEAKVPWNEYLRDALITGLGVHVIQSWQRPNRRGIPYTPGTKRLSKPHLYLLIDNSGSIGPEELHQFFSEALAAAKYAEKLFIIVWDVEVQHVIEYKSRSDLPTHVRGGGGTEVLPALKWVDKNAKSNSVIAILTDGYWFDDNNDTKELLETLQRKHREIILVTTEAKPKAWPENMPVIKIE